MGQSPFAQMEQDGGAFWDNRRGRFDQLDSGLRVVLRQDHDAQQMQRVGIVRFGRQHPAITLLGLVEAIGLVVGQPFVKGFLDRGENRERARGRRARAAGGA